MIKIEPLFVSDYTQTRALLKHEPEEVPAENLCSARVLFFRGLAFWQHWLPCQLHVAPSVYVAKEDGVILGLIALRSSGKSKACWQVDHLVVHPRHRGRGIAQELLRYVFALFGSQGVGHFVSEVSDQNSAGLSLFGSCGFRRCSKITHYRLELQPDPTVEVPAESAFRLALPGDKQALYQLHQEALPADIRLVFSYCPSDFAVTELPLEKAEKLRKQLVWRKVWYWVSEDLDRRVLTSAVKVTAHGEGDYHLELAVHPGWTHMADGLVAYCLANLRSRTQPAIISAKAYDFQPVAGEALESHGMERAGGFCLLAREHWVRAKYPKRLKIERSVSLPSIPNPAINFPLATERRQWN